MNKSLKLLKLCRPFVLVLIALHGSASFGQVLTTLVNFNGTNGSYPTGALVQGLDGNLYGVTQLGGSGGGGTIFRVTPSGVLSTLVNYSSSARDRNPYAGLLLAADGNFYGTTSNYDAATGCGNAFQLTAQGILTVLAEFKGSGVCVPIVPLIQAPGGTLYGGSGLGDPNGNGNLFSLTTGGTLTNLVNFNYVNGSGPFRLLYASDRNIYGITTEGGTGSCLFAGGTVFRFTSNGITSLVSFTGYNGAFPIALLQALDGKFYGATMTGGPMNCPDSPGCGALFSGTLQGHFRTIAKLQTAVADAPTSLIQASDGNLYGGAAFGGSAKACSIGCGTIFKSTLQGQAINVVSFPSGDPSYGQYMVTLTQATDGSFYGTTFYAGSSNQGTIFQLDLGLPPFVIASPAFGKANSTVNLLGSNLSGTTAVSFNGIPATYTVVSATQISVVVPSGATSGQVSVTTPAGLLNSNTNFLVLP